MTTKLYETDSLCQSCTATVLACTPADTGYEVELDSTVFFPEGGGQLSDVGWLGRVPVTHVREQEGHILHRCASPLSVGAEVEARLDWPVRLDHMQQHTGEHILSHAIWKLWGASNVGFHMSSGHQVTIDLDQELTPEQLIQAEDYANRQIWENHTINCYLADPAKVEELEKKKLLRKKTDKVQGELRIVAIEGGDVCTCCGTHLPTTGVVGQIKIIRQEHNKGGVRLLFLCGRWALEDFRLKNSLLLETGALLSVKPEGVPESIKKMKADSAALGARLRAKTAALWDFRVAELRGAAGESGFICTAQEDCTPAEAKLLLQKLTEDDKITAVVLYGDGVRVNYLIGRGAKGKGDCGFICQLANGLFNGKGGGKATFAQGGGNYSSDWKERAAQLLAAIQR